MIKDITGNRYGRLVAIKPTQKRLCERVIWECKCDCGKSTLVSSGHLQDGHTRSCGCLCREKSSQRAALRYRGKFGKQHPNWEGGRWKPDKRGYIKLSLSAGGRYIYEHDLIMEKKLGRPLGKQEVVHHIDGNGGNNNPENLYLFSNNGKHTRWHKRLEEIATYD